YATGQLGCGCRHGGSAARPAAGDAPAAPRAASPWPLWRKAYAEGDPLPRLECQVSRPRYEFDEGDVLPAEYKGLLLKMLRDVGRRRVLPFLRRPQRRLPRPRLARILLRAAGDDVRDRRARRARPLGDGLSLPRRDLRRGARPGARAAAARQVVPGRARHVRP